jgi:hypothetical protein
MQKSIFIFTNSAGALLLALASALLLINWITPLDAVQPRDPIFLMSLNNLFWIIGVIAIVAALLCFFSERLTLPILLLAWLAANFFIYRIGLLSEGCRSLTGYLGGFAYAFGISAKMANIMADIIFAYFLIGSCVALWAVRQLPPPPQFEKMHCPSCGTHVQFTVENLGQQIPCPHCQETITLRKPEDTIKMTCVLCCGHVEFPAHALGQKISCPHCAKTITLLKLI